MVENYAWGIAWQFGYYKHPPLFSWIAAGWFELFPHERVFYHLLAATSVGVTLGALWRISRRFLDGHQQILLVACAFFLPPLTFLSANYNATSAMLPFWALTVLFYIRMIEGKRSGDALLTGIFAALAMLTKYHSAVLLLALAAHLVLDPKARPLLLSRLPWLACLAGLLVLAPHVVWLFQNDFQTLRYAAHQGDVMSEALASALRFVPVLALYALPAFAFLALLRRRGDGMKLIALGQLRLFRDTLAGRALLAALVLPVAFTILLGIVTEGTLSSLWTIPFFALLPLPIVLCLPRQVAQSRATTGVLALAGYCAVLLVVAPIAREETLERARSSAATPLSAIALQMEQVWRERTGNRLAIIAGAPAPVVNAASFYAPDRPHAIQAMSLAATPWVTGDMVARQGVLVVCAAADTACTAAAGQVFGPIDETVALSVPEVEDSGGPDTWDYTLLIRRPRG